MARLNALKATLENMTQRVDQHAMAERLSAPLVYAYRWIGFGGFCACGEKSEPRSNGRWYCKSCEISWSPCPPDRGE